MYITQRATFAYNFKEVDQKWQKIWNEQKQQQKTKNVESSGNNLYILGQFPYPSGNIHMGHVRVYTICDVLARHYKQKGMNVINPMGWDSFGLPAENAAIAKGVSPKDWTNKNIKDMKDQLMRLGFDFDWDRELATHTPEYYKHTQRIFLELFKKGLAYKKEAYVNWDPEDQTVLANEQIDANGCSWRSGVKVEKKLLSQWFFKIIDYAEEMLNDLNHLDKWPDTVKEAQRGWIGRSEGAKIIFSLKLKDGEIPLTIFTTRPDTIYGATFVAISHESPIIQQYLLKDNQVDSNAYERYIERLEVLKSKGKDLKEVDVKDIDEGLLLRNVKAVHPLTKEELPVYLTSYVLNEYGTGSIMGVPFHDERDCAFALKNNISMIQVIDGDEENNLDECKLANSGPYTGLKRQEAIKRIMQDLENQGKGQQTIEYRLRDWLVSRQRYWGVPIPIIINESCSQCPQVVEDLPVLLPELNQDKGLLKQGQALGRLDSFLNTKCPKCSKDAKREIDTLDTFVDSSWYFLRFLDPHNKDQMFNLDSLKKWMPVDIYVGGMEHAIMHLLYARFIHKFLCDLHCIKHDKDSFNPLREPFKELIVQGLVKSKTYKLKENGKYISQQDAASYKADEVEVTFEKMSKSKGNGVAPDAMSEKYGVDTLRLALMFSAPPESDVNFDENFLQSMKSFMDKISKTADSITQNVSQQNFTSTKDQIIQSHKDKLIPILNLLLDYQTKIHTQRHFHVAIARLMELNNLISKMSLSTENEALILGYLYLIKALYPFTPHLCSEIWNQLGNVTRQLGFDKDISKSQWDDIKRLLDKLQDTVKLRISLDGKFMGVIDLPKDMMGDSQAILEKIRQLKPNDVKKVDEILKRQTVQDFKSVIAFKDKPIVNFITK